MDLQELDLKLASEINTVFIEQTAERQMERK